MKNKSFYLINLLSFFRLISSPTVFFLILFNLKIEAFILFLLAILSDLFDGFLARKLNLTSKIGKYLDSIADISLIIFSTLGLYISRQLSNEIVLALFIIFIFYIGYVGFRLANGKKDINPRRKSAALLGCFFYLTVAVFILQLSFRFKLAVITGMATLITFFDYAIFSKNEKKYIYSITKGFYQKINNK